MERQTSQTVVRLFTYYRPAHKLNRPSKVLHLQETTCTGWEGVREPTKDWLRQRQVKPDKKANYTLSRWEGKQTFWLHSGSQLVAIRNRSSSPVGRRFSAPRLSALALAKERDSELYKGQNSTPTCMCLCVRVRARSCHQANPVPASMITSLLVFVFFRFANFGCS